MPKPDHWFTEVADHLGAAYLRYSFTKGTEQEVDFLIDELDLKPGMRLLDVGCGPGRHSLAFARRGIECVGVDISATFIELAQRAAHDDQLPVTFMVGDARALAFEEEFDAAVSLCQGAFGLQGIDGRDGVVLEGIARALRRGGRVALSAFSSYFQVRYLEDSIFDAATGVNHERTEVKDAGGAVATHDLWTTCFTPRELRMMADGAGFHVDAQWSVEPGKYARRPPDIEHPEFLMVLTKR